MERNAFACVLVLAGLLAARCAADDRAVKPTPGEVLEDLQGFYAKTAWPDGSFQNGIDPDYLGMSDSAYSDLAAVTYAVTIHKTFGWKLPHEEKTVEWLLSRQQENGDFINVAGTVDPKSPQGRVYNTTQALVALHALGVKPKYDPLPVFEEILKQDYKTLPAYSTSFFPLAYLCAGKPIPEQADRAIRALMVPHENGYLNDHVAATFHSSHYYSLVGEPTPKGAQMVRRVLRDQAADGSWLLNSFSRDRHATFDAIFILRHERTPQPRWEEASRRATQWALSCRNSDGGFGHFPGSTSDADANYFQVGTLVMTGFLKPADPLPPDPELLSWGHVMPPRQLGQPARRVTSGWVAQVAFVDNDRLVAGDSQGKVYLWGLGRARNNVDAEPLKQTLHCVAFSPEGQLVAAGGFQGDAFLINAASGRVLHRLSGHRGAVASVTFSPNGKLLVTGGVDQTIRLWDVDGKQQQEWMGHKSWVNALAFLNDETFVSGSSDGTVKLWNVATRESTKTLQATNAEVRCVAVSRDGKHLAAGLRYGVTKVWDTTDWSESVIEQKGDDIWSVVFSADSQQIITAAGEWNKPTEIVFWSIAHQKPVRTLRHTGEVLSLALSPDGKRLAAGGMDKAVNVWRLDD
jgi:geranylgeranyl transferase type-2 subunit beta